MAEQSRQLQQHEIIIEVQKQLMVSQENNDKVVTVCKQQRDTIKGLNNLVNESFKRNREVIEKCVRKENELLTLEKRNVELQQQMKKKDEIIETLKLRLSGALSRAQHKHFENDELMKDNKKLSERNKHLNKELKEAWKKIERINNGLNNYLKINNDLREKIQTLKSNNNNNPNDY